MKFIFFMLLGGKIEDTERRMTVDQLERIRTMEQIMDKLEITVTALKTSLEEYQNLSDQIRMLENYYSSEDWRKDFDDDSAGKLPENLKRGVLSEDGLWNLLTSKDECLAMMKQISTDNTEE